MFCQGAPNPLATALGVVQVNKEDVCSKALT